MRKKVLFGLGALTVAVVLSLNVSLVKSDLNAEISLGELGAVAQAQAEGGALPGEAVWSGTYLTCYCARPMKGCLCVLR